VGYRARAAALVVGTLAACALPPRETDRTTPEGTFRTFRGAAARAEYEREWDCLSDQMRRSMGIASRTDWKDARAVVLTQDHLAIKALKRAKIIGEPETLPDGRIRLNVAVNAVVFRVKGTITLRREVVLRGWIPGESEPYLDERLSAVRLLVGREGVGVRVPSDVMEWLTGEGDPEAADLKPGMEFDRLEAAWIWFLDSFQFGDETPTTVQQRMKEQGETQQ